VNSSLVLFWLWGGRFGSLLGCSVWAVLGLQLPGLGFLASETARRSRVLHLQLVRFPASNGGAFWTFLQWVCRGRAGCAGGHRLVYKFNWVPVFPPLRLMSLAAACGFFLFSFQFAKWMVQSNTDMRDGCEISRLASAGNFVVQCKLPHCLLFERGSVLKVSFMWVILHLGTSSLNTLPFHCFYIPQEHYCILT
jgi:hypothetical protein